MTQHSPAGMKKMTPGSDIHTMSMKIHGQKLISTGLIMRIMVTGNSQQQTSHFLGKSEISLKEAICTVLENGTSAKITTMNSAMLGMNLVAVGSISK